MENQTMNSKREFVSGKIEEQRHLRVLFSKFKLSQSWVAKSVGISRAAFTSKINGYNGIRYFSEVELLRIYDFISEISDQVTIECMAESYKIKEKLQNLAP